jgi:hypothetical protein
LYTVTVPVDLDVEITAPLVLTRRARYTSTPGPAPTLDERTHIGGTVVDRRGQPIAGARVWIDGRAREPVVSSAAGEYVLPNVPTGPLRLHVARGSGPETTAEVLIPSPSYQLVID